MAWRNPMPILSHLTHWRITKVSAHMDRRAGP